MADSSHDKAPVISVYGSSATHEHEEGYRQAQRLGASLAAAGACVACGGYAGIMEAVSRGAAEAGGHVIGYTLDKKLLPGRSANRYLSEERPCAGLHERLRHLIHDSDALVALNGGIGTIAEVFLAWNEIYLGLIEPRPLIVVGPCWSEALDSLVALMELTSAHERVLTRCEGVSDTMAELRTRGVLK